MGEQRAEIKGLTEDKAVEERKIEREKMVKHKGRVSNDRGCLEEKKNPRDKEMR